MKTSAIAAICCALFAKLAVGESSAPDSAEVKATIDQFHQSLAKGDAAAAMKLLAPEAVILESGSKETREEYAREHLTEDIAFALGDAKFRLRFCGPSGRWCRVDDSYQSHHRRL